MATTYRVYLNGGPCDGGVKTLTQRQFHSGSTTCKGATYVYNDSQVIPHQRYVFDYLVKETTGGGINPDNIAPQALPAWGDLRNQVNRTMPNALRKIGSLNRATSTKLAQRRRRKG